MSGFAVSTLEYRGFADDRNDSTQNCLLVGLIGLVVFLVLSRPSSPMYHPAAHRAGMQVTSMFATVGNAMSARLAEGVNAVVPSSNVYVDASVSKTTSNIPTGSNVLLIDAPKSRTDPDGWKAMTDAEKSACEGACRTLLTKHAKAVVMLYAPWCPHCHNAMPGFASAAAKSKTPFVMINAEALPRTAFQGADAIAAVEFFPSFGISNRDKVTIMDADPAQLALAAENDASITTTNEAESVQSEDDATATGEALFKKLF